MNAEFQRIARRDKKAFLSDQCKVIEQTTEWERLEISSRKLEIPREHFMQRCQRRVVWMWFGARPGAFGLGRAQPQRRGTSP